MIATDLSIKPHSDRFLNTVIPLDSSFAEIDWQAPWLCHLNQLDLLSETINQLNGKGNESVDANHSKDQPDIIAKVLNTALHQHNENSQRQLPNTKPTQDGQAQPLRFVSQNALPEGEAYESFISRIGNIPTRDNLHDLFNGSIWLTFPNTKAVLNYHHMIEIAEQGIGESRGRVRDTITVFDENRAILVTADPSIGHALINFDWQKSLVSPRDKWDCPYNPCDNAQAAVYVFGHALLEQLITPRKPLCAHSIVINVAPNFFALSVAERMRYVDDKVANHMDILLSKEGVTPRQLAPLPILGVPHFWADNANPIFYDDPNVFRDGRRQKKDRK